MRRPEPIGTTNSNDAPGDEPEAFSFSARSGGALLCPTSAGSPVGAWRSLTMNNR